LIAEQEAAGVVGVTPIPFISLPVILGLSDKVLL